MYFVFLVFDHLQGVTFNALLGMKYRGYLS